MANDSGSSDGGLGPPSPSTYHAELRRLKQARSEAESAFTACYIKHGWQYSLSGLMLGTPLSLFLKKMWPFYVAGTLGIASDQMAAYKHCKLCKESIKKWDQALKALQETKYDLGL